MSRKFKVGSKVRIIWDKTGYFTTRDYMDTGEVKSYTVTESGTPLVELYNFHRRDRRHSLHFPIHSVYPLGEVVKDGDTL